MNRILDRTHRKANTDLLRARDYWFHRARHWGQAALVLSLVPTVLLIISYFPIPVVFDIVDPYRDYIIAIISIALFFVGTRISNKSDDLRAVSNEYRELYDLDVLGVPKNPFVLPRHNSQPLQDDEMYKEGVRCYRDHPKYEAWYEEVFSDHHSANVIVCQMDNALYTYYLYKDGLKLYWALTIILLAIVVVPAVLLQSPATMLLIFIATFDLLVTFLEAISEIRGQLEALEGLRHVVLETTINLDDEAACAVFIRELQDAIVSYRSVSAFLPRFIRLKHLGEDSAYYKDLNAVKARLFAGRMITRPETDAQITTYGEADEPTGTLEDVHDVLRAMLADVVPVLEEAGIRYALDGGTLIGAMRKDENGHFVFWDDDIDLALDANDVSRAMEALRTQLGDKYDVQCFDNDPAYSPRLANFRIRHRASQVAEKDSVLYENYRYRGIFIDVYAYTPTLGPNFVDRLYRRCRLHPLNAKLQHAEEKCFEAAAAGERMHTPEFARFTRLKDQQLKRIAWYTKHAHNQALLAYTPNYLYKPKKAGPYLQASVLWSPGDPAAQPHVMFEGVSCAIPADADAVLTAYYGDWREVPFRTVEQMKATVADDPKAQEAGAWYSNFVQAITPLKHLRLVDYQDK